WGQLLEDFHPFAAHRGFDIGEAGDIAARTRKARNDAVPDRIGHRGEYDRYAAGCLQHSDRRRSTVDENRFGCGCHKLHGEGADAVGVGAGPAVVDANIVTLAPAALRQPLPQCRHAAPRLRIGLSGTPNQRTDPRHSLGLLRACRERPCCRAAENRDERTSVHSITSSARASSVSGTVKPSAFAVLRLITSSYFVGACTGRSLGFSPLRMRST